MAIKIWVNEQLLDVTEDTQLTLKSSSPIFETEIERGEYTYPFKLPLTQRNSKILGFPEQLTVTEETFTFNAELERLGSISSGILYIDSVGFDHTLQQGYADCTFAGTDGKFLHLIEGKKMWEITYGGTFAVPEYDPIDGYIIQSDVNNYATLITNGTVTGLPFVFPMIKWHNFGLNDGGVDLLPDGFVNYWKKTAQYDLETGNRFADFIGAELYYKQRLIPMFQTKWIIQKIFAEYGFTVSSDFFDTATFEADIIINSYSINRWQTDTRDEIPYFFIYDLCHEINPANHVPDMYVIDFLNTICKRFNGQFLATGPLSYEFVQKNDIFLANDSKDIPDKMFSPYIVKKLNETIAAKKGINLEYATTDDDFDTLVIAGVDSSYLKGSVDTIADLAGVASPQNQDIYLVVDENKLYKYNTISWEFYCMNYINLKKYVDGNDISIDGAPLVNTNIGFTLRKYGVGDINYSIHVPEIDAPGNAIGDEFLNGELHGVIVAVHRLPRTYLPLRFMLYYGMVNNYAGDYEIPYCSGHNYDQTTAFNKVFDYNLGFYGPDGIYNTFYRYWNAVLAQTTKYEIQCYLPEHEINALSFRQFIIALGQKFLLYSRSFVEPHRGVTSFEVYKVPYYIC